jgi:antitoxin MazE
VGAGPGLLVARPHAEHVDDARVVQDRVHEPVLDVDAAREGAGEIADEPRERRGRAVRTPRSIAADAGFEPGDEVDVTVQNGSLIVTSVVRRDARLADLLARVTPENLHEEADSVASRGGEGGGRRRGPPDPHRSA